MRKIVFDIETKDVPKTARFDPRDLEISVLCAHDSKTDSYLTFLEHELDDLWPILEHADLLVGYNSDHFDIPLLNKYYPGDLTRLKSVDLLKEIKKAGSKRVRLDAVAKGTLGKGKSGHGLQAVEWWKKGEVEKVKQYCLSDVKITKELYDYARANQMLKYADLSGIREVKIDTSSWEEKEDTSMTRTLPF